MKRRDFMTKAGVAAGAGVVAVHTINSSFSFKKS